MSVVPAVTVPAPEPRGLRYGLFTAATGPLDLPVPHGRGGGVQYEPVSCGFAREYPVDCPAGEDTPVKVFDFGDPTIQADPFVVYASLQCGAVGHTAAELETKVRRRLANGEQTVAEGALSSILANAATPTVDIAAPYSIVDIVAGLEQWLYGTQKYGNIGVIHAPVRVAAYAAAHGLYVADGPLRRTPYGTIWSVGGGYTGAMPGQVAPAAGETATNMSLIAEWFDSPGGSPVDLAATPNITITAVADSTVVVGPTTVGVGHPATGVYTYTWDAVVPAGDYLVVWSGTDAEADPAQASEVVTVGAGSPGDDDQSGLALPGVYITGNVALWRAPDVHVYPADQVMNRATNQRLLIAEREYAVAYDCLAAGAAFASDEESS